MPSALLRKVGLLAGEPLRRRAGRACGHGPFEPLAPLAAFLAAAGGPARRLSCCGL